MGAKTTEKPNIEKPENKSETNAVPARTRATRIMQANVPSCSVEEALKVPQAIWDHLAGKTGTPLQVSQALDISPSSSNFRDITGASIAYGFTSGGYNAKEINLEPLGKRAVAPTIEGDDLVALQQAAITPAILKRFFEYYQNKKLPKDSIAENLLISWGVPKDRAADVYLLIKENGNYANLITNIKGNDYVTTPNSPLRISEGETNGGNDDTDETILPPELLQRLDLDVPQEKKGIKTDLNSSNNKVFISHGKNRKMVENLKELLVFGSFEPIVSVEREATAISVPEKVFSDMRECCAGIIHIEEEKTLLDETGTQHKVLNENVLIEIGAAIALYGKKIILLCQKGITLPSNLQGLYKCEYEGDKLDYDATMKLLKTFNTFKTL